MILFLSKYPQTEEDLRDGAFQRVVHVDSLFENREKVYLVVSPYKYFKKAYLEDIEENRIIIRCNLILCFGLIVKLFRKSKIVYIHSLHNLLYLFVFLKIFNKKYILDLHGLVPEEFALQRDHKKVVIFNTIEKYIYNNLNLVIGVTQRMLDYYESKYSDSYIKSVVYPILPNNLVDISKEEIDVANNSEIVNFIYSGNLQEWQNIDLMLDYIKNISVNRYFVQILTGEVSKMKNKFEEKNINMTNVDIRGVKSNELAGYYKKAHYGFVLRDDIPVNNAACPTKLIEYMNYGIIPIVLSEQIGDFKNMGYENLSVNDISGTLIPKKSLLNIKIIKNLYFESNKAKSFLKNLY